MYKVERSETEKFSHIWNKGGINIILTPEAVDFATAWANVVLNNFIAMCQQQVEAHKIEQDKKLIVEGI